MKKYEQCVLCGEPLNFDEFDLSREIPKRMKKEHICYRCAFWKARSVYDKHLKIEDKIAIITPDYNHWISKRYPNLMMVNEGFGIYKEVIQPIRVVGILEDEKDKKSIILRANNLTHQGVIPEHLRNLFNPNAIFLTPEQAKFLDDYRGNAYEYIKNLIDNFNK